MHAKASPILTWLTRDRLPADLYELLGVARLDPDAERLRAVIRQANRELLAHLDDPDAKLADRAARLQTELARADRILADPVRRRAYEARLIRALRDRFAKKHGNVTEAEAEETLRIWLEQRLGVHPRRVAAVMRAMEVAATTTMLRAGTVGPEDKSAPTSAKAANNEDLLGDWRPQVDDDPTGLIRQSRESSRPRRSVMIAAGAFAGAVVLGVGLYLFLMERSAGAKRAGDGSPGQETPSVADMPSAATAEQSDAGPPSRVDPSNERPAREHHPLDLRLLPAGSRVLVAARPARLVGDAAAGEVVRGLGPWADAGLAALSRLIPFDPADVERVLVGLIPGEAGAPPDRAAVVHLARPIPRRELLDALGRPAPATVLLEPYFVKRSTDTAYYIADPRTLAILPDRFAREVLRDVRRPLPTSPDIEALVEHSDREAAMNVVFDVRFLREEAARSLDAEARQLVTRSLDLLGDEVVAGLLSLDTGESFRANLVVRCGRDVRPSAFKRVLEDRLRHLPYDALGTVQAMHPPQPTRRLIGRFPAMVKALAVVLEVEEDAGSILARAVLPERAGVNLALAGRLTWEEYQAERSAGFRSSN